MFYARREIFNKLSIRLGMFFSKFPLTANQWTLSSLLFAFISFYFLINQGLIIASIFFFFTAIVDIIDGSVARVTGKVSTFGAYLDTIVDRLIEFILVLGLLFINYPDFLVSSKFWLLFLLFGSYMTTYVKSAASEKKLVDKELRGGLLERSERLMLTFLIIFVSAFSLNYGLYLIVLMAVLTNLTALQRFVIATKQKA